MNEHAVTVLEFPAILKSMLGFSLSGRGAATEWARFAADYRFMTDEAEIEASNECSSWFASLLATASSIPYENWEDLSELWDAVSRPGYVATVEELTTVLRFAKALDSFLGFVRTQMEDLGPELAPRSIRDLMDRLPPRPALISELSRVLDGSGGLREENIPELKRARQRISQSQAELRSFASSYVREHSHILSGDFATIRDGRTVLPLKTGFKGQVEGFIHHASSSGETLFMEPWALVEKNNAVTQAEHEFQVELQALLRRLTAVVNQSRPACMVLWDCADWLDRFYARARHCRNTDAQFLASGSEVRLIATRHPLLGKKAVPIDMVIPEDKLFVVLSGPNTGGKTVSLKTLGLSVLMRQAGIAVQARAESVLPVFHRLLVDIGDEQSISADLSTFSGHLSRIRECLEAAGPGSLVLLDELGAGTDPEEGAALALAVGEAFLRTGCLCMATSHYAAVKALAYTETRAMNASMDYNPREARPTYRVVLGLPGASHALDTAERVGILPEIVARARAIAMAKDDPTFDLVSRLTREHVELKDLRAAVELKDRNLKALEEKLREQSADMERRERNLEEAQLTAASRWLDQSRSQMEAMLRRLQELEKQGKAHADAEAREARELMKAMAEELRDEQEKRSAPVLASTPDLPPGTRVRFIETNREGTIMKASRKGSYEVEVAGKRIHVRWDKLSPLKGPAPVRKVEKAYTVEGGNTAQFTLDVRGMRLNEVLACVERQVDAACLQHLDYFAIIHGKGEGVLQKAIHEYLSKAPGIARFEFARPEDGGFGKTLVFLRS